MNGRCIIISFSRWCCQTKTDTAASASSMTRRVTGCGRRQRNVIQLPYHCCLPFYFLTHLMKKEAAFFLTLAKKVELHNYYDVLKIHFGALCLLSVHRSSVIGHQIPVIGHNGIRNSTNFAPFFEPGPRNRLDGLRLSHWFHARCYRERIST